MLGGEGKAIEHIRPLTMIEQSLLDNVIRRFIDRLRIGWEQLVRFSGVVESREMDPQFIQVIPSSEMVMVVTFSVQAPGELEAGEICFCIPFISLDTIIGRLGDSFQFASAQRTQTKAQREHLDHVIEETMLPVQVRLGGTQLSIGEILDMHEGDILVLNQRHDQALDVIVNGHRKLTGRGGRLGKKMGLVVEAVLPDGPPFLDMLEDQRERKRHG
jgi:flagellar motor switch protein FliM